MNVPATHAKMEEPALIKLMHTPAGAHHDSVELTARQVSW